ncbi:MAG: prepilin peptidase [Gammaproteobacteria bacterium]|nr:prepilin peptidase [Gammaproteobacteria bacterium]MDH3766982.1 prepilin peptidase [Gammaproteobacteria bacterium]
MSADSPVAVLRPGIALGAYPENVPRDAGQLDRMAERLVRRWRPLRKNLRPAQLRAFVELVDSEGAVLQLREHTFNELADELRQDLARSGLRDKLVARSFALVRAVAEEKLGLRHYDTQLMAGRILLEGALAEMETGEGKTLAATLPACTAALAGIPVHVVTANDYLVTRDAAAMGPVYRALGLTVGAITEKSTPDRRRTAYARSITYNTSKQLAFDYLRDRIAMGKRRGSVHLRVERLYNENASVDRLMMRGLCFAIIDEADSVLIDEARTPFIIANERDSKQLEEQCSQALRAAKLLDETRDYTVDISHGRVELTTSGQSVVAKVAHEVTANARTREALVEQALSALHLFHRDRDYLVRDDRIQIIDPNSGRVMEDRSWNLGLHQMIELKEGCPLTAPRDTLARLTFQRFFRRYLRMSGMTGTAREVQDELWSTYRLPVVPLPTHKSSRRQRLPDLFSAGAEEKRHAIVARAGEIHAIGRPVLIGTRSVAESEHISALLNEAGLQHKLLNARQDAAEARIVAEAGRAGQITVATNMAGRGTDISLGAEVIKLGGLHVIATEHNDARRLDRQLYGRCGRHGEPGSYEFFHCLDDEVLVRYWPSKLRRLLQSAKNSWLARIMLIRAIVFSQKRCERRHRNERRDLAIMQDQMDRLLSFSGRSE